MQLAPTDETHLTTIKLTDADVVQLCMALGAATAKNKTYGRVVDRILVQLGPENHTNHSPKAKVIAELKADGIEVPK